MKKPKHHYCHRVIEEASILPGSQHMEVLEKIGEGSFGQVYKVLDTQNSRLMVLKKSKEEDDATIRDEAHIMKELSNTDGFRRVAENSKSLGQSILMNCLGTSLGTIMKKRKKMNVFTMRKIAVQLIRRLQELHSHRYVHRDLKPENLLLGDKLDSHSVYLIDFGLVTPYRGKATKRRRIYNGLVGTAKFSSLASHDGLEQFPKDDMESLGYILLYLLTGTLPWDKEKSEDDEELFRKIRAVKKGASLEDLCGGFNCLRNYVRKVQAYHFTDKIDYEELAGMFLMGASAEGLEKACFDFCEECWVQGAKGERQRVEQEPRANLVRVSILE